MANMRKAADDRSFMNKIYRPVAGYVGNVAKETRDLGSAYKKALNESANYNPDGNAKAAKANKEYDAAKGQFIGALVGKRYDSKGKRR
jgi:hypothetical protein